MLSRTRILPTLLVLLCGLFLVLPGPARAAVPAAWPFGTLQIGMRDDEHGAAALRQQTRLGIRYHYLSGGANTQGGRVRAHGPLEGEGRPLRPRFQEAARVEVDGHVVRRAVAGLPLARTAGA